VLPFVLLSGVHQALIKPLPVGQSYCTGWPLPVPDAVPVGVRDWCNWWGIGFWRKVGGRNDGEFVIGREEGVLIVVVVGVNDGKVPVVGSTGVTPTFEDGGPSMVDCLDVMLGEDDS
jgi:hypothetical protein